ncbi:MAG: 50S ribosomal protein L5 [Candidatus Harrisonbacteria bacterium]|nr:50S ribosomal protein L5 [Candidatus Harrisonbacteria bacterium]
MTKTTNKIKELEKIVVNTGVGRLSAQPNFKDKVLPSITEDFALITGQKPEHRPARKSIAGFKLREGVIVGLRSTLRKKRMVDFLERIVKVVLPRVRDFRGIDPKNIDNRGNLSFGIKENVVFPEISQDMAKINFGIEVTIVPKSEKNKKEAVGFYKELGIPFKK